MHKPSMIARKTLVWRAYLRNVVAHKLGQVLEHGPEQVLLGLEAVVERRQRGPASSAIRRVVAPSTPWRAMTAIAASTSCCRRTSVGRCAMILPPD